MLTSSEHRLKATAYNYAVALIATLGSFTQGFNSGIIAMVLGQRSWYDYFKLTEPSYTASIIDACMGMYYVGGVIGCWTVNWLCDSIGRRRGIQCMTTLIIVGVGIQTGSVHIAMFIVGRFLGGVGAGLIACAIPIYLSEISPAAQRGRIVGLHGVFFVVALACTGYSGVGVYFEQNPQIQWRLLVALQLCAPLLLLVGSLKLPESPPYLIQKGKGQEALTTLAKLHHVQSDSSNADNDITDELSEIQAQLALDRENGTPNLLQLLKSKQYRKRMFMGFLLECMTQTTGILVINNYMVIELAPLGVTGWVPLLLNAILNTWCSFLNLVNAFFVDRIGRIKIILIGMSGGVLSMCVVAALSAHYGTPGNTNKSGSAAAVAWMFIFVTFYGGCVDASSFIYMSEIFPTKIRARGVGFAISGFFLTDAMYLLSAAKGFATIGWKFYLIFIIVPALAVPVIYFFFPETKGLSLEEVGRLFGDQTAAERGHLPAGPEDFCREAGNKALESSVVEFKE